MILFTILLLTLLLLVLFVVAVVSLVGGVGIIVFGDVIVCIVIITLILAWIIKRRGSRPCGVYSFFSFREKYTLFNGKTIKFKEVIIMMNFIILAAGVMVGTLAATGVMVALTFNKKVLKAYFNYAMKLSEEIVNEKIEEMSKEEEEA